MNLISNRKENINFHLLILNMGTGCLTGLLRTAKELSVECLLVYGRQSCA